MKVSLEGHIPILRVPTLHVFQPRGQQVGVHELFVLQDHAGFQLDMVRKASTALIDPDRLLCFVERRHRSGGGGEATKMGDIQEDAVAFGDPLDLPAVLGFETK